MEHESPKQDVLSSPMVDPSSSVTDEHILELRGVSSCEAKLVCRLVPFPASEAVDDLAVGDSCFNASNVMAALLHDVTDIVRRHDVRCLISIRDGSSKQLAPRFPILNSQVAKSNTRSTFTFE